MGDWIRDEGKGERRDNPLPTNWDKVSELICLQILEDLTHTNLSRMLLRMQSV